MKLSDAKKADRQSGHGSPEPNIQAKIEQILARARALEKAAAEMGLEVASLLQADGARLIEEPTWLTLDQAAHILGRRDRDTAVRIITQEGLGQKIHGKWRVDPKRIDAFLNGRPYDRIVPSAGT